VAEEKKEDGKAKKPLNVALIIKGLMIFLNVSVLLGGSYLVYAATLGWSKPSITEELEIEKLKVKLREDSPPLIYTMDKFTVNLDGEPKRAIQVEVNLQMLSAEGFEEVMAPDRIARARDKILRILNEKDFSELETLQGKLFLKDRIAMEVNSVLNRGVVKDVFFSNFVIQ